MHPIVGGLSPVVAERFTRLYRNRVIDWQSYRTFTRYPASDVTSPRYSQWRWASESRSGSRVTR